MQTLDFFYPKEFILERYLRDVKDFLDKHSITYYLSYEEMDDGRYHYVDGDDTEMMVSFHLKITIPDPKMATFFKLSFTELKPVEEWF